MLTPDDVKQLAAVLVTKEDPRDFYNRTEMDEKFGSLDITKNNRFKSAA